ncbi:MAG: PD40 domain-containing protein [Bacteroidales bacterium]|nr:PD40 domain-containing protein [Bacteroidales bacterium]
MKYILTVAILLMTVLVSSGIEAQKKELKKARNFFDDEEYYQALQSYEAAEGLGATLDVNDKKIKARCHYHLNHVVDAYDCFSELESSLTGDDVFYYARCNQLMELYSDAIDWFEKAKSQSSESYQYISNLIESCKWAENNVMQLPDVRVNPCFELAVLGQSFGMQYYKDNKLVYSSTNQNSNVRDKNGREVLNLFYSDLKENVTDPKESPVKDGSKPQLLSKNLEAPTHVGAVAFTSDYKYMYYTKMVQTRDGDAAKIFVVEYNGKDWGNERELTINSDKYDCAHPAITPDDKYLYFVSNRPDGFGGKDIYYCERKGPNSFGPVKNCGSAINTFGEEVYPVFNPDGKFYFSSDGRNGYGGLDIYVAEMIDDRWQNIQNMKKPFNSSSDDFGYIINPNNPSRGFLSSNNYGNKDADVIFLVYRLTEEEMQAEKEKNKKADSDFMILDFDEPEPVIEEPTPVVIDEPKPVEPEKKPYLFNTTITSTYNGTKIEGASLVVSDAATGSQIASGSSDEKGRVIVTIPGKSVSDDADYNISVTKSGYNDKSFVTSLSEMEMLSKDGIALTPIFNDNVLDDISGMEIPYGNDLDEDAKRTLDKLAAYLLSNPNIVVKLNGHTEAKGNRYGNLDVSQKMAEKAKAYVVAKGVNEDQMICRGYGERYLKNRCHRGKYCDKEQHAENRRIEVVVWNVRK